MVMQRAVDFLVGGSNPGRVNMPPPQRVRRLGVEPPTIIACAAACRAPSRARGGGGAPLRPLVVPIILWARDLFCSSRDKERRWGPTDPTSVDGRPAPTRFVEPFLEILAES